VGVVVLWLSVGSAATVAPYSPTSAAPDGAKALALMLERLGARVTYNGGLPAPDQGVALLLYDQLDDAGRAQISAWVRRGGTLVVADPASPLSGAALAQGAPDQAAAAPDLLAPDCRAPWARGVDNLATGGQDLLEVPPGASACFVTSGGAFAISRDIGAGVVVTFGGAAPWSNAYLGVDDNALLAANLLVSARGAVVSWLLEPQVGGGTQTIWSLVPARLEGLLGALGCAALTAALWRGRRLGQPVLEAPLVPLPGSELVLATGRMLARNGQTEQSALLLREELGAELRSRLGLGPSTDPATVAQVTALYTRLPAPDALAALAGPLPASEDELVAVVRALQRMREEVLSGRASSV
jgi:hypothetical protein